MRKTLLLAGACIAAFFLFTTTACKGDNKKADSTQIEQVDTIALVQGKQIPYEELESYMESITYPELRKLTDYVTQSITPEKKAQYGDEDWIFSTINAYNEYAKKAKIEPVDRTYAGVKRLVQLMKRASQQVGENCSCEMDIRMSMHFDACQEDFLDLYSIDCMKYMFHKDVKTYNAMMAMNDSFTKWADAQQAMFNDVFGLSLRQGSGSFAAEMMSAASSEIYHLRPMTSFYTALNNPEFKTPAPCSIDLDKAIEAEYAMIHEEVGSPALPVTGERVEQKPLVEGAQKAFKVYAEATDAFLATQPSEVKDKLLLIVNGKKRTILVRLKQRYQETVGEGSSITESSSDAQIEKYKNTNTEYWQLEVW